jgi:hypothetical protein
VALGLTLLLILVMANQVGFTLAVGGVRLPVTLADVVLGLAFLAVVLHVFARRPRDVRLPPASAFVLVGAAIVALLRTDERMAAAREVLQLIEYVLVAWFVFVNVAKSSDLKPYLAAFAAATGIAILWGGVQYLTQKSALHVRAGFLSGNHHVLGAFLAMALPFFYGIALYARTWRVRGALLVMVLLGLAINLDGGTLLVTVVVLAILSGIRGQRALVPYLVFVGLALTVGPRILPRPNHTDTLVSSVAVYVDDNYLLSDEQLRERAEELLHPTKPIPLDKTGEEMAVPAPRPLDAARLLRLLNQRRGLTREEGRLQIEAMRAVAKLSDRERAVYPLNESQVARRYQRWNAAIVAARATDMPQKRQSKAEGAMDFVLGRGFRPYHEIVKPFMGERLQYRTDEPEVFNVAAPEPFTHNQWLKTFIQMGVVGTLALAWLVLGGVGQSCRLYRAAHGELALGASLGVLGGLLGFAFGGLWTEVLARGLAIPFVFLLAVVPVVERIVHGDPHEALERPELRDD